ncbi:MAG: Rieske 2Fe-2S domain-containing protein [Nostoc sp. LLA-1]|nr:Rieske 2Fe-2S domain-containing protein [Cyanocohniella sp. LLY]
MTLEAQTPDTLEVREEQQEFNWRQCWYPICFVQDLPKNRPYGFSLYDEPFVLFTNQEGILVCLTDRCPHRAAKLSDGQIIDGKIECSYHGWQFGIDGQCLHIPQLPTDATIPVNACVQSFLVIERQGLIWMWTGNADTAMTELIPTIADLDLPEFVHIDYVRDLPYDQAYLIENFVDPAHVYISHDGTEGNRQHAQPLAMEVSDFSVKGFRGKMRPANNPHGVWQNLDFIAPNLVHYQLNFQPGWDAGIALYSIPLGKGKCRLLLRRYRNFRTLEMKLKPLWLEHFRQNKVLEQDLPQIIGQQAEIARSPQNLNQIYLPLKTSDLLVISYRKWLDEFGDSLPYYQGYLTLKNCADNHSIQESDRFSQHTLICSSCNQAYRVTSQLKQVCIGVAIALAALAIITDGTVSNISVALSLVSIFVSVGLEKLKTHFQYSYTHF